MTLLKVFWGAVFILFNNLGWEGILISSETSHRPLEVWDWSKQAQNLISSPFPSPGFHTSMKDVSGDKTPLKWHYVNNSESVSYMSHSGGHHVAERPKFSMFTGCCRTRRKLHMRTSCPSRIFILVFTPRSALWSAAFCFLNHSPYEQ